MTTNNLVFHGRKISAFHEAGYKGLYGGLSSKDIKKKKGIPHKEQLMDRMNTTELAANQFRMTQTREKIAKENIKSEARAINTHYQVGKEVREAISRIGGTPPENIPSAEHIKHVAKRIKGTTKKLQLGQQRIKGIEGSE